jgi:cobalt/nickel transport system permease protein
LSTWWVIFVVILGLVLYAFRGKAIITTHKIATTAMVTAVSYAVFQISIPLFGGVHMNLTPLVGMIVGPPLGTMAVLIVNIFSAAIGHGGWGMIGANSIVNTVEVTVGYYLFRLLKEKIGVFSSAVSATVSGLIAGTLVMVALITISGIQGSALARTEIFSNLILLAGVNVVIAVTEGLVTGFAVKYIHKLRPDLLANPTGEGS